MTVTPLAPAAVVVGSPRAPFPFGLFSVLAFRTGDDRWETGVQWETVPCAPVDGFGALNCADGSVTGYPKSLDSLDTPFGTASAFGVYGHWNCRPVGYTAQERQEKAEDHLLAYEQNRVEQALWTGDLGNTPNLSTAPAITGTFVSPAAAVGALEAAFLADFGGQGVLHTDVQTATQLIADDVLDVRGGRLVSALGTPVVAGPGYTAGSGKVVATAPLFGYRSEILFSGDLIDTGTNDLTTLAERQYLIGYDTCGAASVTLTFA